MSSQVSASTLSRWSAKATAEQHLAAWLKYLDALPWAPGKLNELEFSAFQSAREHGNEPEWALTHVLEKMRLCGVKNIRKHKVRQSLQRIYLQEPGSPKTASTCRTSTQKPVYDPALTEATAQKLPASITPDWFQARSPLSCFNRSVAGFLHVVFKHGETVFVTTDYYANSESEDAWLWANPDPLCGERLGLDCLDFLRTGYENVWYLANPVSGQLHPDQRLSKGASFRCLETIVSFRHIVVETDLVPDELWLLILAQLPLRIKAIYHSGKRGYHALVQIDASTKEEAEKEIELLKPQLVQLGACDGTLTPHRITRLPNCMRIWTDPESGKRVERLQRLIYLNPHPTGQPICELPEREPPYAPWLRWAQAGWSRSQDRWRIIAALKPFAGLCPQVDSTLKRLEGK
jgi:hypothetical protein